MTRADEVWLIAESAWWGNGRRFGPCALPLPADAGAAAAGQAPVPVQAVPSGAPVRRVAGTLLPGLHDEHVHAGLVDLAVVHAHGIAVCHDLGSAPGLAPRPGDAGRTDLRLEVVGAFLTAPGGYPSDRAWAAAGSWREVRGIEDAAAAVAEQVAVGASAIKLALHLDAGPVLAPSVLRAVVDAAHALARPVVVHAEGEGATRTALDAGADRLAHAPWTERLDPGVLRACAERTTWISTLDIHGHGTPSAAQEVAVGNVRGFLEAGGRVRYGTDLGNGPLALGVNPREIRALQACGMSPDDVLASMTDLTAAGELCWVEGGLDLDPAAFATSLATARVLLQAPGAPVAGPP